MTTIAKLLRSSTVMLLISIAFLNCGNNKNSAPELKESASRENLIFPRGEVGPAINFTGKVYNYGLVANDSVYHTLVGNVYFEPGARSNWHKHPAGQILIITDGQGYHQIEGQPKQTMKKGDVIKCPPNVRHWHGASENSSLSQLYIIANTDKGIVEWQEPVTDEQYKLEN